MWPASSIIQWRCPFGPIAASSVIRCAGPAAVIRQIAIESHLDIMKIKWLLECQWAHTLLNCFFGVLTIVCALLDDIWTIILRYKFARQIANHTTSVCNITYCHPHIYIWIHNSFTFSFLVLLCWLLRRNSPMSSTCTGKVGTIYDSAASVWRTRALVRPHT